MDSFYARADESNDLKIPFDGLHNSTTDASSTSSTMTTAPPSMHRSKNDGVVPDFIQKLFNMLESTDETSCYHWGRQGTAFVIDDTNEFAKTVLPSRFKHGNFSSFVRQLNKYDFHKIRFTDSQSSSSSSVQQQAWEFQHPLFRRDKKHLLAQIRRKGNNHPVKKHQQSAINNKASSSASPPPFDNTKATSDPSAALAELHELHASLQTQIDKLSSAQQTMASTLGRLVTTDTLLLNELQGMKRKMDEKDSILSTLLDLPPAKKQQVASLDSNQQDQHHHSSLFLSSPLKHESSLSSTTPPSTVTTPMPTSNESPLQHPPYPTTTTTTTAAAASVPSSPTATTANTVTTHPPPPPSLVASTAAAAASAEPTTILTPGSGPPTTCHPWRHRPKVLVVEDNVMYRRISMRCLERLGCDFDMACDGLEAVAWMKQHQYDLILMDISIPKLDGMAATRKLRQYDQHTPVVSMTANYSDLDIQNYVGSGMSDLLPKPFDQHKLYDILKQHCAHLI